MGSLQLNAVLDELRQWPRGDERADSFGGMDALLQLLDDKAECPLWDDPARPFLRKVLLAACARCAQTLPVTAEGATAMVM